MSAGPFIGQEITKGYGMAYFRWRSARGWWLGTDFYQFECLQSGRSVL